MAGIVKKAFDTPDEVLEFVHGRALVVRIDDEEVWRSELTPGWNWDEDLEPYAEGATSCPMTHREYVVGRGDVRADRLVVAAHQPWKAGEATA